MNVIKHIPNGLRDWLHHWPKLWALVQSSFQQRGLRARFLWLFYLITLGSVSLVGYFGYDSASNAHRSKANDLVAGYTVETANKLESLQEQTRNGLDFIANDPSLLRYNYWHDMADEGKQREWMSKFADQLRIFAGSYAFLYKIHFIDASGKEIVGVKRDWQTGLASVLSEDQLQQHVQQHEQQHAQQHASAEIFARSMKLSKGEYYASTLVPNREHGKVEQPLLPVLRFATPVIGENNTRYGVVVITVLGEAYFKHVRDANSVSANRQFFLVGNMGDYLYHPDQAKSYGLIRGHSASFNADFPELLDTVEHYETQQTLDTHGHIMSFLHIHPNVGRHENGFILVGMVDNSAALADLSRFVWLFAVLLIGVALMVMIAARYFIDGLMRPLEVITLQLQRLGRGEVGGKGDSSGWIEIDYQGNDEISRMIASSRVVMLAMERLAEQADVISRGDFSGEIPLLSEQDRLGTAINNMTHMLRDARNEEQRNAWLKDGISQMNQALAGDMNEQQLADAAISLLGRYLDAGRGVFYVYQDKEAQLELLGSYMFSEREALGNRFKLGEGAVGQVAREKKPIMLHAQQGGALHDNTPVVTGTLSQPPQHIYTWPLLREGELLGVIELASFERYDARRQEFIARAADVMASFLYIVGQREKIKELLRVAEAATRQAQEQSRQLQLTNTQMEEQQQQLQQQSAELQATNSQMEEQQQQLQQQSAELQASNGQMEEAQLQLEERNRELLRSQAELDARAKQLALSSKYKSEFLANMSHELRTPLNSIILLAKLMTRNEDNTLGEEAVKRADVIHRAGLDLLRLINDVLDLSKVEAGRMELHAAPIATQTLADEFRDFFSAPAGDKGLTLQIEDRINGEINVDRDKVTQVVRNLLSNAIKFTPQGQVTLRFERCSTGPLPLCISVSDSGIGVAADKQKLIFEAFQQADGSTSREYGGTGLGLSISLSFARLMGGTIELVSTAGEGSTFTLLLPQTPPTSPQQTPPQTLPSPIATHHGSVPAAVPLPLAVVTWPSDDRQHIGGNDAVLLLIDDDPVFAQAILDINHRLGYKTLLAGTGADGLALARSFNPNGILLDLGLPDMDGSAVLHQLKSHPDLAAIPVYIISGRDRDNAVIGHGALGWLHKPVDAEQIAQAEAEVLAKFATLADAHKHQDILLLTNGALTEGEIAALLDPANSRLVTLPVAQASADKLHEVLATTRPFRFAILDLGIDSHSQARAHQVAALLHALLPEMGLIFYGDKPLGDEDEAHLRQYSDSIIIKTPLAERRLQDNISHFLQQAPQRRRGHTEPDKPAGSGNKRLIGRHILVVDDDPRNLFVLTAALEQHGAKVETALNGRKALDMLATLKPDLVVMDIMMPEMDGYKTIETLRARAELSHLPVIALTAKALPSDRARALAAGADDYLAKPADYDVLVNMVAAWCQGRQ